MRKSAVGFHMGNIGFELTLEGASKEERREEERLHAMIRNEAGAGKRAATGIGATLKALQEKRVRWMLISPLDSETLSRCESCGAIGTGAPDKCAKCGERCYAQSAANELSDLAFTSGARVEFTDDRLEEFEGVGALLRW